MRTAAALLVSTTLVAGLGLAAVAPAGASAPAKTSKFCKALKKTDYGDIGNPTDEKKAAQTEKQLTKLAKAAKGKTKKAVETIRDAYGEIADGEDPKDVFADGDVALALGTFGLAVGKCALSDLPDITLPDITLPDIDIPDITLPNL